MSREAGTGAGKKKGHANTTKGDGGKGGDNGAVPECEHCGRRGHRKKDCWFASVKKKDIPDAIRKMKDNKGKGKGDGKGPKGGKPQHVPCHICEAWRPGSGASHPVERCRYKTASSDTATTSAIAYAAKLRDFATHAHATAIQ